MSMAEDMRNICQDIANARAERAEKLNEIKAETRKIRKDANEMINDFWNERRKTGTELKDDLKKYTAGIKKEVRGKLREFKSNREAAAAELRDELDKTMGETRKAVKGIKKETENTLTEFASDRKKMGKELKSELSAYTNYIGTNVDDLMKDFHAIRNDTIRELEGMHSAWEGLSKVKPAKGIFVAGKRLDINTQIIDALSSAPRGLSLPELGKKIGVNWRILIRPVKALAKEKKIGKKAAKYLLK